MYSPPVRPPVKLLRLVVIPGMSGRWKVPSNVEPGGERWLRRPRPAPQLGAQVRQWWSVFLLSQCTECKHRHNVHFLFAGLQTSPFDSAVLRPAPTHRRGLQPRTSGCPLFLVALTPAYPSFRRPADPASPSRISELCGSHRATAPHPRIPDLGHACTSAARAF